jgi:hypothetical protein
MGYIIYDERLELEIDAFKDVLQSRNAHLDDELSIYTTLSFFFDNIFGVFMPDGVLAGWFAVEKISRYKYHTQVSVEEGSPVFKKFMMLFTWLIIECYQGVDAANNWWKNLDVTKFNGIKIQPVLTEFFYKNGGFFHMDNNNDLPELPHEILPAGSSLYQLIDPDAGLVNSPRSFESQLKDPQPWENIEDNTGNDKFILSLWWAGHDRSEIAKKVHLAPDTITNRITELRKKWGDEIVPLNKDKKRKLMEGRDTA